MPLPVASINKRAVVFVDTLSPMLSDIYRAFDVQFVLTSNVASGRSLDAALLLLAQAGLPVISQHLAADWSTPHDADSNLEEQVDAWHATVRDRTPTSYLVVTTNERGEVLGDVLRSYAVIVDDTRLITASYVDACRILHSQLSFDSFNPDWY